MGSAPLGAVGRLVEDAGPAPQRCFGGAEHRAGFQHPTGFFPSAVPSLALLERQRCRVRAQVGENL